MVGYSADHEAEERRRRSPPWRRLRAPGFPLASRPSSTSSPRLPRRRGKVAPSVARFGERRPASRPCPARSSGGPARIAATRSRNARGSSRALDGRVGAVVALDPFFVRAES